MKLRTSNIQKLSSTIYDALIIGGGINGAVSAAALSGKGAKVALIDQRAAAKRAKNFAEADRIRQDLLAQGVVLKDGPTGTTWEVAA